MSDPLAMLALASIDHYERQTMSKRLIELNQEIAKAQSIYVENNLESAVVALETMLEAINNYESAEFWRNRFDELTIEETQLEKAGK